MATRDGLVRLPQCAAASRPRAEDELETLRRLYRYTGWANARVIALCRELPLAALSEPAAGTQGTLESTIKHLVAVEALYLAILEGSTPEQAYSSRDAYFAQDIGWFFEQPPALADGYARLLAASDEDALKRPLKLPWFDLAFTAHDGLVQVVTHSALHRAQILSALGARGVAVPDLDYVLMLGEAQGAAGDRRA